MPSARNPHEHTPRLEAVDDTTDTVRLVCQCGWTCPLTQEQARDDDWRGLAAAHRREVS